MVEMRLFNENRIKSRMRIESSQEFNAWFSVCDVVTVRDCTDTARSSDEAPSEQDCLAKLIGMEIHVYISC